MVFKLNNNKKANVFILVRKLHNNLLNVEDPDIEGRTLGGGRRLSI